MGRPALWVTATCLACQAVFITKPYRVRQGRAYCGPSCSGRANYQKRKTPMVGNRYAWRGDKAGRWAHHKRAQKVMERRQCTRCDRTTHLVIHHQDENPANNSLENLEVLCRACHARHHGEARVR
jgi:hypothetical protein